MQELILIPFFAPFHCVYDRLCPKCLHPLEIHTYVVAHIDGREARRCAAGVCACIVMAPKPG